MENNTFKIRRLAKWREESVELFQAIGLRPSQYESLLGELADLGTEKIIASNSQFLFAFDEVGAEALAERTGKCIQTIHNWRRNALNEKSKKATGN